jgi:hypothetical protein
VRDGNSMCAHTPMKPSRPNGHHGPMAPMTVRIAANGEQLPACRHSLTAGSRVAACCGYPQFPLRGQLLILPPRLRVLNQGGGFLGTGTSSLQCSLRNDGLLGLAVISRQPGARTASAATCPIGSR